MKDFSEFESYFPKHIAKYWLSYSNDEGLKSLGVADNAISHFTLCLALLRCYHEWLTLQD